MKDSTPANVVRSYLQGDVQVILLDRPMAANALDTALLDALGRALHNAREGAARAIVLGGTGRNFCAGSDLKAALADPFAMDLRTRFHPVLLQLSDMPKPVVAAVNGAAAGGGMGLALAADLRVMGQGARFVPSWLPLGLVPDVGVSWFLAQAMGPGAAFDWLASGRPMMAEEAVAKGLANQQVADGAELNAAVEAAARLAAIPGPAVAMTRRLLRGAAQSLAAQLEDEAVAQAAAMRDPDQVAALAARVAAFAKS